VNACVEAILQCRKNQRGGRKHIKALFKGKEVSYSREKASRYEEGKKIGERGGKKS